VLGCGRNVSFLSQTDTTGFQVICDRHFGGINYPKGGVGAIAQQLADGLVEHGGEVMYKANVKSILLEDGKAVRFGR
jgi:phytoene dehydrogenase-like protein